MVKETKFTVKAYLMLILSISIFWMSIAIIPAFFTESFYDDKVFPKLFVPSILFFSIVLLFGEIRTKFIKVEIESNQVIVKRFLGLKTEYYKFSDFDGWKFSHLSSRGGTYEYLYLYRAGNKVIKLSQFYHKNYSKIKSEIERKFKCLGYEKFSILDEFKEMFK